MKKIILSFFLVTITMHGICQGCIAIRNIAGFGQFAALGYSQSETQWMLNTNIRYFRANHLYRGSSEQPSDGIVNDNMTINFSLSRIIKNGWSVALDVPILSNSQYIPVTAPQSVHVFGISDVRFTVYKWLGKTDEIRRWNIQAGLGLKLPTGNYRAMDYLYVNPTQPSVPVLSVLPGSLQLGDGGTGVTTELNGYFFLNSRISFYSSFFYLFNPVDVNGAPSGFPTSPAQQQATYDQTSVADAYTSRAGANITLNRFVASVGMRYEGTPGHDVFGESHGLRRAGHIASIETGLQYKQKRGYWYSFLTLPVAKATVQSDPDKVYTNLNDPQNNHQAGQTYITPGHFSNWLAFVGYAFMF